MADDIPANDPPVTPEAPPAAIEVIPALAPLATVDAPPAPVTASERATVVALDWLTHFVTNSPVSRDQACWAHVVAVLPDLIDLIAKEL